MMLSVKPNSKKPIQDGYMQLATAGYAGTPNMYERMMCFEEFDGLKDGTKDVVGSRSVHWRTSAV